MDTKKHKSLSSLEKDIFFKEGIYFFNRQDFYECHESLEHIWLQEDGINRLFYQGLIQAASAFHHVKKNRYYPALQCLRKSIQKLSASRRDTVSSDIAMSLHLKIDVDQLLSGLKTWEKTLVEQLKGTCREFRILIPKIIVL